MEKFKFTLEGLGLPTLNARKFDASESDQETTSRLSYLGTPVFSNLEIPAGQYKDNDGNLIAFDGIRLDAVLMTVTIEKNIVRTAISGRNGTVKQYISLGDYAIDVQALIIGQTDASNNGFSVSSTNLVPESEVRKLNEIIAVPQEIEIVSEFIDFFDVSTVVIVGGSISQREGYRDSFVVNLGLLSDTPIELKQER